MPDWQERHVPDLGIALVELLAYAGDHLSYYQDAVATEAYLDTARQRISVRRHARLVDYLMHEGCNARAWVCIEADSDLPPIAPDDLFFVTGLNQTLPPYKDGSCLLTEDQLRTVPSDAYEVFEPLPPDRRAPCAFAAHTTKSISTHGAERNAACRAARQAQRWRTGGPTSARWNRQPLRIRTPNRRGSSRRSTPANGRANWTSTWATC